MVAGVGFPNNPMEVKRTEMLALPATYRKDQYCDPTWLSTVPRFSPGTSGVGSLELSDCAETGPLIPASSTMPANIHTGRFPTILRPPCAGTHVVRSREYLPRLIGEAAWAMKTREAAWSPEYGG